MTSTSINSNSPSAPPRFRERQKRSCSRGNDAERFIWDGLALVHRDGSDYLNEPAIGGGNPIASDGTVMFNDRLGSTVAVKGDESYSMTSMTAFGESSDSNAFFTGKPFIGELGYAFLMRSYRPENGKWQTADPMGYPDGWNQLAYCNNHATSSVDLWGCNKKKEVVDYHDTEVTTYDGPWSNWYDNGDGREYATRCFHIDILTVKFSYLVEIPWYSKLLQGVTVVSSAVLGYFAGTFFTVNPLVGVIVGTAVGYAASEILEEYFEKIGVENCSDPKITISLITWKPDSSDIEYKYRVKE